MRRNDKEITDTAEKLRIIAECKVCRLALCDRGLPYIVPLNYGYAFDGGVLTLYFHGAREGRKIDIIRVNNTACFEVDCGQKLIEPAQGDGACKYGYAFKSVVGWGKITFVEDRAEKTGALSLLMAHQTGSSRAFRFDQAAVERVLVFKMTVEEFTGKHKELPQ
ncbi:MAG: pyridoxamine 5'-phosphate oxidase family protein [Spirochaetaceae bacterium]|jgi:nitroimidazol reductase NimA-like FMN-containing flavoprotein (pyridoxamine 5'-phosphate oxidase superfamily)|nr:pyridoxamine 5'-phosphate oxidase family protein [Spirochaetaceae bacterium]